MQSNKSGRNPGKKSQSSRLRLSLSFVMLATNLFVTSHAFTAPLNPGQVVGWNHSGTPMPNLPAGLSNVVAVAGGGFDFYALKSDGTVTAWGSINSSGQTNVPVGLSNVVAIAAGGIDNTVHSLALKGDGTVTAWGSDNYGETNVPAGLSNVIAVAAGHAHSLALKSDHTVVGWGSWSVSSVKAVSIPANLSNVVAVAGGLDFSVAVKSDGTVVQWGVSNTNTPPDLTNIVGIAAGDDHCVGLRNDGTVISWGMNFYNQTNTPAGLSNVIAVAAGQRHSMALKNDGSVVVWGYQESLPSGLTNVVAIAGAGNANGSYSLAVTLNLTLANFAASSTNCSFRFHTFAKQSYSVETTSSLNSGVWQPLPGGDISGTGQDIVVTDTNASATSAFYRLKRVQ